uniref:(northern house mosquito) hypothetical protein n=1 Tax=Culex pipiens TaxID=7175 RepID=A0A8D8BIJ9_CULPI
MMVADAVRHRTPAPEVTRSRSVIVQTATTQLQSLHFPQPFRDVHPLEVLAGSDEVIRPLAEPAGPAGSLDARRFDLLQLRFMDMNARSALRLSSFWLAVVAHVLWREIRHLRSVVHDPFHEIRKPSQWILLFAPLEPDPIHLVARRQLLDQLLHQHGIVQVVV